MITVVRSFTIQEGKVKEAFAQAAKVASYLKENYSQDVEILRSISGPFNKRVQVSLHESLAAWEEDEKKLRKDASFQKLIAEGHGLVRDHTVNLYETAD